MPHAHEDSQAGSASAQLLQAARALAAYLATCQEDSVDQRDAGDPASGLLQGIQLIGGDEARAKPATSTLGAKKHGLAPDAARARPFHL